MTQQHIKLFNRLTETSLPYPIDVTFRTTLCSCSYCAKRQQNTNWHKHT